MIMQEKGLNPTKKSKHSFYLFAPFCFIFIATANDMDGFFEQGCRAGTFQCAAIL